MPTKAEIEAGMVQHIQEYGDWAYDIPLPHGIWTGGNKGIPHTRLRRVLQIAADLLPKPLSQCRVLDLACLDGIFTIEFGLQGARATGIEIRTPSIRKADFARRMLGLEQVEFRQEDVRNISLATHGNYDVILCSGILYHLTALDAIHLLEEIYSMTNRLAIIDTHLSLLPETSVAYNGRTYHGKVFGEHRPTDSPEVKAQRMLASIDNETSFWFSRPSLVNLLTHLGYSSVYECFAPAHLNFGSPGIEHVDRCTIVAVKGQRCESQTSPAANQLQEDWPEDTLTY